MAYFSLVLLPLDATDFLTTAKKLENRSPTVGPLLADSSFASVVSSDGTGSPASLRGESLGATGAVLSSALSVSLLKKGGFFIFVFGKQNFEDFVLLIRKAI